MVKQRRVIQGFFAVLAATACGGGAKPVVPPDPYWERVGACIDGPRGINTAVSMIDVPAGEALLGSSEHERAQARHAYGPGAERLFANEAPVRRAALPRFKLDRSPVTPILYAEFVSDCGVIPPEPTWLTPEKWEELRRFHGLRQPYAVVQRYLWQDNMPPPDYVDHPMVLVTHDQAGFYCAWRGGRLPSEEEWERAARGPSGFVYPWGNRWDGFRVHGMQRGANDTIPIGRLAQGNAPEGFTDMGGHVWEWTSTPWEGRRDDVVVKGNGWDGHPGYGRGAARVKRPKDALDVTHGFRCASNP